MYTQKHATTRYLTASIALLLILAAPKVHTPPWYQNPTTRQQRSIYGA